MQKSNGIKSFATNILLSDYFVLYLSIAFFLIVWAFIPAMGGPRNIENILSNMWPLLALTIGQMFVLILAGIDLSQTGLIGFLSVIGGLIVSEKLDPALFEKSPLWGTFIDETGSKLSDTTTGIFVAILAMVAIGVVVGIINGTLIAKLKMPAFMVTLVMQMLLSALALFITKSENVSGMPDEFITIGNDYLVGVFSIGSFIVIGLCVLAWVILQRSKLGRWLYATGMNPKTSRVSGVPVDKVTIFAYAFSGLCAAIGSLLYTTRMMAGRPTLGADILMDIIGGAVIGGTSMFGGKGKVTGTIFGVLFFTMMSNALNHMKLDFATINIAKGAIILAAAYIDVTRMKLMKSISIIDNKKPFFGGKNKLQAGKSKEAV